MTILPKKKDPWLANGKDILQNLGHNNTGGAGLLFRFPFALVMAIYMHGLHRLIHFGILLFRFGCFD